MEPEDEFDDERSSGPLLPPDDRLWRHPSELALTRPRRAAQQRMWTVAVFAGLVGALIATGTTFATGHMRSHTVLIPAVEQEVMTPVVTLAMGAATTSTTRVRASCVALVAKDAHGKRTSIGVVFRSDGMTFAVAHMVTGAQALTALVAGRVVNAHLIGDDPVSDVAVVKLDGSEFPPAPLGTALGVRVGDPVTAMSPSDSDEGLVSALSKTGLLQVTTDRDGDMPGTPVLDRDGAVIALAAAGAGSKAETATPMDWAKEVAAELISSGHAVPVWLGVQGHDLAPSAAAAIGVGGGAVIDNVLAASPASTAGVRAGDVVLGVDGRAVRSFAHLLMAVHALPVGSPLQLDVRRGATDWTIDTVLTARPPDA